MDFDIKQLIIIFILDLILSWLFSGGKYNNLATNVIIIGLILYSIYFAITFYIKLREKELESVEVELMSFKEQCILGAKAVKYPNLYGSKLCLTGGENGEAILGEIIGLTHFKKTINIKNKNGTTTEKKKSYYAFVISEEKSPIERILGLKGEAESVIIVSREDIKPPHGKSNPVMIGDQYIIAPSIRCIEQDGVYVPNTDAFMTDEIIKVHEKLGDEIVDFYTLDKFKTAVATALNGNSTLITIGKLDKRFLDKSSFYNERDMTKEFNNNEQQQ